MCFSPLYISAKLRNLMKIRDSAFKSKNREAYTTARADLSRAIKEAKRQYADKINTHFTSTKDTRRMWQGIQTITSYKSTPPACSSDPSLPDQLYDFFARFEAENKEPARKMPSSPNDQVLSVHSRCQDDTSQSKPAKGYRTGQHTWPGASGVC